MQDTWNIALAVIASLGGGGFIVLGLSSWLGKVWASRILADEKNKLDILRTEHQIRFSKLHEEQALAIKKLYSELLKIANSCSLIEIYFENDKKGLPQAKQLLNKKLFEKSRVDNFRKFYKENEIFFSEGVCRLINEIWESDSSIWFHAMTKWNNNKKDALETVKDLNKKIEVTLEKVKKEFRLLLGVQTS